MESRFDPMTFGADTMVNYQLSQKLKLIGKCKFNHLIIILSHFKNKNCACAQRTMNALANIRTATTKKKITSPATRNRQLLNKKGEDE
jgi:hypothetical protein